MVQRAVGDPDVHPRLTVAAGIAEQRYARGSEPVNGEQVVIMAWRGLRARVAGALRRLRRLGLIVTPP